MKADLKLWKKQEKRIVKLLYKKGFLKDFKIEDFYWSSLKWLNKKMYKSKGAIWHAQYVPELHFSRVGFWGECDEHSVVDAIHEQLYYENVSDYECEWCPKSTFKIKTREQFIKYLIKLPTVIGDNKIRKVLTIKEN